MKDWKGNEFKEGDTVVIVKTQPLFGTIRFGMLDFLKDGSKSFHEIGKYEPPKHCWEIIGEYELFDDNGTLRYILDGIDMKYYMDVSMLEWGYQPSDIFCIKGVSDNEEEYYKQYFK